LLSSLPVVVRRAPTILAKDLEQNSQILTRQRTKR